MMKSMLARFTLSATIALIILKLLNHLAFKFPMQIVSRYLVVLSILLAMTATRTGTSRAGEPTPILQLEIKDGEWAGAPPENIRAVCFSAGSELTKYFPGRKLAPITINHDAKSGPITLYARGPKGETQVRLNSRGLHWAQYSYQFAHELCHILCNYRKANNPQMWFEESLCETASIFAVQEMSKTWKTKPPYPNWITFAPSLEQYAADHIKKTTTIKEKTFAEWYRAHSTELEKNAGNRELNQVIAVNALLPLIQKHPQHWEAVSYLNQWPTSKPPSLRDYLTDWHKRVPATHKPFVKDVAKKFEIEVE